MSAKPKIEVVPTARDRLREAHAKQRKWGAIWSELTAKLAKLSPFKDAVAQARAELERIEQADADAMRAWVNRGAVGAAPIPDNAGRVDAARKLASAEASLRAAGVAKDDVENQLKAIGVEMRSFTPELHAAAIGAIGEEIFLAIEKMQRASLALLESDAHYKALRSALQRRRDQDAGNIRGGIASSQVNVVFNGVLQRIGELSTISPEERSAAWQAGTRSAEDVLTQLLADEDPKE
jgi:hypothetical protein